MDFFFFKKKNLFIFYLVFFGYLLKWDSSRVMLPGLFIVSSRLGMGIDLDEVVKSTFAYKIVEVS